MTTNKELVEQGYASFAVGDVPGVLGLMDDKVEWFQAEGSPIYSASIVGPQDVLNKVFMRLGEIGDNFTVSVDQLIAEGDTVVALGNYHWNHKVSGEPAEVKMAHVWTLADGKLVRFQQHLDTARVRDLIA